MANFGRFPRSLAIKMSSLKEKTLSQRKAIKDTELEELVVNGLAEVEGMAKADKWDGRHLLATPIHRIAGTGAIASSQWCLLVGPIYYAVNTINVENTFVDEFIRGSQRQSR